MAVKPVVNQELGRSAMPLLYGSIFFICLWALMQVLGFVFVKMKKFTEGHRTIYQIAVTMAAVCMWMMWAMVWLAQLNPILLPSGKASYNSRPENENL